MTTQLNSGENPSAGDAAVGWRDRKRHLWMLGLVIPTMLFLILPVVWALNQLGWHVASQAFFFIGPFLLYVVLPAADMRLGVDGQNPPESMMEQLELDKYYRYCVYAYIPFQYASVILSAYLFTAKDLSWLGYSGSLGWLGKIGLAFSVGIIGGVAINTAHELGHKRDSLERWLSKIALAQVCYGHFYIEHNRGHHVRVATPEDPASARFGESFWAFLPRTVIGSAKSAVALEAARIRRTGKSPWNPTTWLGNDVINALLMSVVFWAVMLAIFGPALIPLIVFQALYGPSLLESVNYLEHYGLLRQKLPDGRYERCAPHHSWNSDHLATNLFLYHLQRHSDHHANPTRRYQILRSMDGTPTLPAGYGALIALTYFPPLWRKFMDHRVLEHYHGDITKANLNPRRRAKILARYGAAA
ncbi:MULTISPECIES: alkane 1-monooxygenase [Mycobacteriaceae]|uniref:alkane 1-monooxygenase n=1 Tax=Mycobacteriaceae TaxID=1762 RepID=UPI001CA30613|nr:MULTISPECIES: alkane 1-monooxygenase [Mycobacteriaceae]QZT60852.1 alkane 1-monooxygenase [Mycolicibacterium austroafricanum]UXA13884.1 alkane 1-monooxygenase [Mycobacterium sp. SMC-8]